MTRKEASQILNVCRPDDEATADPQVREALEMVARDPELKDLLNKEQSFDQAFRKSLVRTPVPAHLPLKIMQALRAQQEVNLAKEVPNSRGWWHFVSLGAAAAITISLALFFTFIRPPVAPPDELRPVAQAEVFSDPIIAAADALFASLQPRMKGQPSQVMMDYLNQQGATLPQPLPPGFSWEASLACDVIETDGARVSVVCFESPDRSGKLHLFTFRRADFPHAEIPEQPVLKERKGSCCAKWADETGIHVLYSDKGRENLRLALDI